METSPQPSASDRVAGAVAAGGLAAFVTVTLLQHALVPRLSPARHMISEYANAKAGALMVAGFLAWSASLLATAAIARRAAVPHRAPLALLLGLAALGLLLVACFATQTSAGALPPGVHRTLGGRLHDAGSAVATLALLASALVAGAAIRTRRFRAASAALLLGGVGLAVALLLAGDPWPGIRQRALVATACAWQGLLLWALAHASQPRSIAAPAPAQPPSGSASGRSAADATGQLRHMSR
jgi:Protein of unknown function (DUF998)